MQRSPLRRQSDSSGEEQTRGEDLRTTIVIPEVLDKNLMLYSLHAGTSKNEVIKAALREFLASKGMRPDQQPKIEFTY